MNDNCHDVKNEKENLNKKKMKTMKINNLLSAAIAVVSLGMTGCSQSEDVADGTTAKQTITFASGEDETTTRTSMGGKYTDASFPFYWEKGDAIYVNAKDKITGSNTGKAARALFTGNVNSTPPFLIRYTGTGHYETTNSRTRKTVSTTSNVNTVVIPPVQTIATWDEGADTKRIGANGDCGTATATGSGNSYSFKLGHKAAYLILMPHWGNGGMDTYYLKSITVTSPVGKYQLSGRFSFTDSGILNGGHVSNTYGSCTIKIITGGSEGLKLPNAIDQTKSITIAIKPVADPTPLYCIYEVSKGKKTYYIEKIISGKSFPVNTITPITADIKAGYDLAKTDGYLDLITNNNPYSGFYEWDAPKGEEYFVSHEMCDDYNTIDPKYGVASKGCSNCPTLNQISWYLKGGCYWDANRVWGPGKDQKGGMWFMKKSYLTKIFDKPEKYLNTYSGTSTTKPNKTKDFDAKNWFFLPATGLRTNVGDCSLLNVGTQGFYWSSAPTEGKIGYAAINLYFDSKVATIKNPSSCDFGYRLWTVQ
jgi:hypothetical protein